MEVKEESKKAGLKLNIQKTKITASGPISSELAGEFFLVVCISRRHLLLGRRAMTNLDSIVKSKDITADKVLIVKAMVFPVVMNRCESWTKKAEHQKLMLSNCGAGEDS